MACETVHGKMLIFCAGLTIVGVWPYADATTRSEDSCNLDILRIHEADKVFHDDVYAVFMEVAMVAEAKQIEFQALALYHLHVRDVRDANLCKVWLTCDRAEGCELWAVEAYLIVVAWMFVDESLQYFRSIVHLIFGLSAESLQTIFFSCIAHLFLSFIMGVGL